MPIPDHFRPGALPAANDSLFDSLEPSTILTTTAAKTTFEAAMQVVIYKNASCGCCRSWMERLRDAGFGVEVRDEHDLNPIKERLGVPRGKGSCHIAEVGGYFVEGLVPAADVRKLLAERPNALGLVLAGMAAGSPEMDTPDGRVESFTVDLVGRDGSRAPYQVHEGTRPPPT
ncbi:MAG: DUF411 domain-containing protein [Dokdonella sp.]